MIFWKLTCLVASCRPAAMAVISLAFGQHILEPLFMPCSIPPLAVKLATAVGISTYLCYCNDEWMLLLIWPVVTWAVKGRSRKKITGMWLCSSRQRKRRMVTKGHFNLINLLSKTQSKLTETAYKRFIAQLGYSAQRKVKSSWLCCLYKSIYSLVLQYHINQHLFSILNWTTNAAS